MDLYGHVYLRAHEQSSFAGRIDFRKHLDVKQWMEWWHGAVWFFAAVVAAAAALVVVLTCLRTYTHIRVFFP